MKKINDYTFQIESKTTPQKFYTITKRKDTSYHCTCEAFKFITNECKHIKEVIQKRIDTKKFLENRIHLLEINLNTEKDPHKRQSIETLLNEFIETRKKYND